ncbi:MAG: hypothetical protein Q7T60_05365 [Sphingopyxis sp.]|nr:hypothetical protein [Sphingopyxis sp.]
MQDASGVEVDPSGLVPGKRRVASSEGMVEGVDAVDPTRADPLAFAGQPLAKAADAADGGQDLQFVARAQIAIGAT